MGDSPRAGISHTVKADHFFFLILNSYLSINTLKYDTKMKLKR
jgi:hypothetical protein